MGIPTIRSLQADTQADRQSNSMNCTTLLTSALTTAMTSLAVKESNPEVGSSRKSTRGLVMSAMPTFVRFACASKIKIGKCRKQVWLLHWPLQGRITINHAQICTEIHLMHAQLSACRHLHKSTRRIVEMLDQNFDPKLSDQSSKGSRHLDPL